MAIRKVGGYGATLGANVFQGVQTLAAGTQAAPSLTLGDSGTGIYRPAADSLALSIAQTAQFRVAADNFRLRPSLILGFTSGSADSTSIDTGFTRNAAGVMEVNNGTGGTFRDMYLRSLIMALPASVTPANNGDVQFQLTSDTSFTITAKGSDGVVRSGSVTLS
jgi:hypothetical protein